jgi:site-specific recombinase XerD
MIELDEKIFSLSTRSVQQAFKNASAKIGIDINPHLLRTVFTEKCAQAGIDQKYTNAFCGRIPEGILAKHYTSYSPTALRQQYDTVEPHLTL